MIKLPSDVGSVVNRWKPFLEMKLATPYHRRWPPGWTTCEDDLRTEAHAGGCLVHEGVDELLLGLGQEDLLVVGLGEEVEELEVILEEWESK